MMCSHYDAITNKKSMISTGNTPAVHLLHLNVAVYIFFHRLYAMYPNNLLDYLRSQYGGKNMSRSLIFQEVVKVCVTCTE